MARSGGIKIGRTSVCCFSRLRYFSVFALLEVGISFFFCLRVVLLLLCLSKAPTKIMGVHYVNYMPGCSYYKWTRRERNSQQAEKVETAFLINK